MFEKTHLPGQAQESGEQFQMQDDIQYALDGLTASALPSERAASAARLAEMAATRRGRLALRRFSNLSRLQVRHIHTLHAMLVWGSPIHHVYIQPGH